MVFFKLPRVDENTAMLGLISDLIYPGLGMIILGALDRTDSAPNYFVYGVITFASPIIFMVIWFIIYMVVTFIGTVLTTVTLGLFAIVWIPALMIVSVAPVGIIIVPLIAWVICLVNNFQILKDSKEGLILNNTQTNGTTQTTQTTETTQNEVETQYDPNVVMYSSEKGENQTYQTTQTQYDPSIVMYSSEKGENQSFFQTTQENN
jgi:hypothetical protein